MAKMHLDIQMRWSDQDAYGHINNVSQARYFEEARIRTFFVPGTREDTGLAGVFRQDTVEGNKMIVANQTIDFLHVLEYDKDPLEVEIWISRIGGASFTINSQLISKHQGGIVTTRCETVAVIVDGATLKPVRMAEGDRAIAEKWMSDPLKMGRG